ncbi:MAG: Peptidoglycan glycosyltransferase [Bacteroidota bacterium]|nr:Peptidoglycan glycosyltransferase [Bacteroidota bacterium]
MSNKKKEILLRAYLGFLAVCLLGFAIIGRVFYIQTVQGAYYRGLAESLQIDTMEVVAERGNIYSADGRLMATTLPTFDIRIDFKTTYAHPEIFKENVDSVALMLSLMFKDKSKGEYKNELVTERQKKTRYYLLKRNITYNQLLEMKQWPMFREGQYKSGMLSIQNDKRLMPFGLLAQRTIGFTNTDGRKVGLEGQYDEPLHGKVGEVRVQKIAGGVRIPIDSREDIAPQPGRDVYTTIDVDLQDVAEDALYRSLQYHQAGHGCVILMEVKTGKIKAIANLGAGKDSSYSENFNYAVGESTEPGSTFKLATVASVFEDGLADNNTKIDVGNGEATFYKLTIKDHEAPETPQLTVKRAVEVSSNAAMAKLAYQCYAAHPEKFYKNIEAFGFTKPIDIELPGAGKPVLADPKKWSGVSVAYIAHGYEVQVTPLHTLMFYNAIANGGKMVKPYVVDKVKEYNTTVDSTRTTVLNEHICNEHTIKQLQDILQGVVENGTAQNLKTDYLHVAGKTGTAVIAQGSHGYNNGKKIYQASFCGYFPAEDPQYSMIVVINSPSTNGYYGNVVAGAIFKEVADKVYSLTLNMHKAINKELMAENNLPPLQKASASDLKSIYKFFGVTANDVSGTWAKVTAASPKKAVLTENEMEAGVVPDVKGMSLKDALYLLESMGMKVSIAGRGNVIQQSIEAGTKINKGTTITIQLS